MNSLSLGHFRLLFAVLAIEAFLAYLIYLAMNPLDGSLGIKGIASIASELAIFNYLAWIVFDLYGWKKLAQHPKLNALFIKRVDLNGTWYGTMTSKWGGKSSDFPIKVEIIQRFSNIEVHSWAYQAGDDPKKDESSSTNHLRHAKLLVEDRDIKLYIVYKNEPNPTKKQRFGNDHYGSLLLTIDSFLTKTSTKKLSGIYWTNKDRLANIKTPCKEESQIDAGTSTKSMTLSEDIGTGGLITIERGD